MGLAEWMRRGSSTYRWSIAAVSRDDALNERDDARRQRDIVLRQRDEERRAREAALARIAELEARLKP